MQAVVLHTLKYQESHLLVYAYTRDNGRQTFLLKGVRKAKNHAGSLFFPMSLLEVETARSKGELVYLKEYRQSPVLTSLFTNINKNTMALFMGELLHRCITGIESDPELFDFIKNSIIALETTLPKSPILPNLHLLFTVQLCARLGYAPSDNYSAETPIFSIPEAGFISVAASQSQAPNLCFSQSNSVILHNFLAKDASSEDGSIYKYPMSGLIRRSFLESLLSYYDYHLGRPLNLRSPEIISQIFHTFGPYD